MIYAQDIIDAHKVEIDRLRAELAKFDGMLPVPAEDANDLDDVVRELGIEASETTPAEAVRELKAEIDRLHAELAELAEANNLDRVALFEKSINDRDARIATLEAAGNRLGDAAVDGVLTSIEAVTELAEAKARIAELEELEADALQCASVEADLRREFRARAEKAEAAFAILRAELSQTKRDLKDWQDSSEAYRHDAEKAEARVAELEQLLPFRHRGNNSSGTGGS